MSVCSPCTQLKQISKCADSIIIGTVGSNNTEYHVYFKNLATGKIHRYDAISSVAGLLTITGTFDFSNNQSYELWVNKVVTSVMNEQNLTIGATTATCYTISFIKVYNTLYGYQNYVSQTLEIA